MPIARSSRGMMGLMGKPMLIVVSGPSGSGKTTLAHTLAVAIGCPAICRDEIKEGMVHAFGEGFTPAPGDLLTQRTFTTFFETLRLLLEASVSVVAEAAFQDHLWRPHLGALADLAVLRIVRCRVDPFTGYQRVATRRRAAHADSALLGDRNYYDDFVPLSIEAPTIDVDTSHGYRPTLDEIIAFMSAG